MQYSVKSKCTERVSDSRPKSWGKARSGKAKYF